MNDVREIIRLIRNTLFRAFFIGLIFVLLYFGGYYGWQGYWDGLLVDRWALIDQKSLHVLVLSYFGLIRFYLVFILLTLALALHWTLKRLGH